MYFATYVVFPHPVDPHIISLEEDFSFWI